MIIGKYLILPVTVVYWREDKKKPKRVNKKTGEEKPALTRMYHRHIWFEVISDINGKTIDNGLVWKFTSIKRGKWSDSRDKSQETSAKPKSLSDMDVQKEIERLTSYACCHQIWQEMEVTQMGRDEYLDLIQSLPKRIEEQTAHSKENREFSKKSNRK